MSFIKNFIADESGASAAEYALIIAIVGVGIGAAALALGANVEAAIGGAANEIDNCNKSGGTAGQYNIAGTNKCPGAAAPSGS